MTWIQTAYRHKVDLRNPQPETIDLRDIVLAIARLPRYTGHLISCHYSVAEHSCHISDWLAGQDPGRADRALDGLMHDSPEAYLGDTSAPMKWAMGPAWASELDAAHQRVWFAIGSRLDLLSLDLHHPFVKEADRRILLDECDALLGGPIEPWSVEGVPLGVKIEGWSVERAIDEWLARYNRLTKAP